MRLFLAFPLSDNEKKEIHSVFSSLYSSNLDIREVPQDNLHITIKYIGEFPDSKIENLAAYSKFVLRKKTKQTIEINDIGVFPKFTYTKILWAGSKEINEECCSIYRDFNLKLWRKYKIKKEKSKYILHCTAGRFRKPDAQEGKILLNELKNIPEFSIPVKLDRVVLFESVLTKKSPIYKEIISFDLK